MRSKCVHCSLKRSRCAQFAFCVRSPITVHISFTKFRSAFTYRSVYRSFIVRSAFPDRLLTVQAGKKAFQGLYWFSNPMRIKSPNIYFIAICFNEISLHIKHFMELKTYLPAMASSHSLIQSVFFAIKYSSACCILNHSSFIKVMDFFWQIQQKTLAAIFPRVPHCSCTYPNKSGQLIEIRHTDSFHLSNTQHTFLQFEQLYDSNFF